MLTLQKECINLGSHLYASTALGKCEKDVEDVTQANDVYFIRLMQIIWPGYCAHGVFLFFCIVAI